MRDTLRGALQMLADTHALLLNGCVFDELPAALVAATAQQARAGGAAVFFDPGALTCSLRTHRDSIPRGGAIPAHHSCQWWLR